VVLNVFTICGKANNVFISIQCGCRIKDFTIDDLTDFVYDTLSSFDRKEYTLIVFPDLSKVFDTIDHATLLTLIRA
jgi:hypothetical protein